ncbi:MAG: hypothetical protein ACJ71W_15565 [Terriglobales bacterium]
MRDKSIADLLNIKGRFLRSANIERDFQDPTAMEGYVVTEFARSCLARVAHGLRPKSAERAWRMTGDYGSGKSSFALLMARSFAPRDLGLPKQLRKTLDLKQLSVPSEGLVPVLVTCSRQPLSTSILQGLRTSLINSVNGLKKHRALTTQIDGLLKQGSHNDDTVLKIILDCKKQLIAADGVRGLLLILDELGKFLEFAAARSDVNDVFLLQQLAEEASRSGEEPLFVVCLLHQGFNAYADRLNQSVQREWGKVGGRFEEIIFNQPIEQLSALIANSLGVKADGIPREQAREIRRAMERAHHFGWFGAAGLAPLVQHALQLYPLHPTILPALIRIFRRFGQNERSLFGFLLSDEPFGLQEFSRQPANGNSLYQLHNFYDYVKANFGHTLSLQSYRSHWNLIDSTIESFSTDDDMQLKILKTVGVLNLVNDAGIVPTEDAIACALGQGSSNKPFDVSLEVLRSKKRVLYDRGRARGFCLWPHTSVDLQKAYEDASESVNRPERVVDAIQGILETRPLVARRHYIETGNLRHFDIRYCSVAKIESVLSSIGDADGTCIIVLPENQAEGLTASQFVQHDSQCKQDQLLFAISEPLSTLKGLVQEVQRWQWISTHTLELNSDKYAREEVSRQLAAARLQMHNRLQTLLGWTSSIDESRVDWFWRGRRVAITNRRQLNERLSLICKQVYPSAPRISNELVNRRKLSSAAAAARMRLIERMFSNPEKPLLGMVGEKKPPEMSIYLSVLKHTNIHRELQDHCVFQEPTDSVDRANFRPCLERIRQTLESSTDGRANVAALFEELRKPPFGVRDGLLPLVLSSFVLIHENETAFYKDGTYLPEFAGEAMLILTKDPKRFDLQYCQIKGLRAELFRDLLTLLSIEQPSGRKAELLTIVKQLCMFVAKLPSYSLSTRRFSGPAIAVRDAILKARDPLKLLFQDLPIACGHPAITSRSTTPAPSAFLKSLRGALQELQTAYPQLQERLRADLRLAFMVEGAGEKYRHEIMNRAKALLLLVQEPKLKAFCLRLQDQHLPELEWIESVGSFLALKPPAKWHDAEETVFVTELNHMASQFRAVEAIEFSGANQLSASGGLRVAITERTGLHLDQVIHFEKHEELKLTEIQHELMAMLNRHGRLGLAAASRAIWQALENGRKRNA